MNLMNQVKTIADLPRLVSTHHGAKAAIVVENIETSYRQIETLSNRVANALIREGVACGDRIAFLGKDSLTSVLLLFGTARCNAVFLNINWRLAADEIAFILADAQPTLLVIDEEFAAVLPKLLELLPIRPQSLIFSSDKACGSGSLCEWCASCSATAPDLEYSPSNVVAQIYTSGTTGHPKGVQLTSSSFFAIVQEMETKGDPWIGWTGNSVSLICVPTFHVAGLWQLIRGLALGCTNIMMRTFNPAAVLQLIPQHRVTITGMVPSMIHVTLGEPNCTTTDFSTLETMVYGGSPISTALLEMAMRFFKCDFCQIYGMTETGNMAVCLRPEDHSAGGPRLKSTGKPLPGVDVAIFAHNGERAAADTMGEIALKSVAAMAGYWNLPDATRETLVDNWIMTGDAGYLDTDGFLYVCDRIKDMIICAGENIYPAEIESVIRTHNGVADVAVIGIPSDLWGEAVKAVVVSNRSGRVNASDIIQHTRAHLAEFKVPASVDFIDQLPRNASGKVSKVTLRLPYWAGRERPIN